ncbi:hypothetical protein OIU77_006158 [Salix suchowensis]|nr:hypothetical protein [Scylla paramamosain]KAJ6355719.1 hypothetical protein OIU77_006158 [Salix suchowensis]
MAVLSWWSDLSG